MKSQFFVKLNEQDKITIIEEKTDSFNAPSRKVAQKPEVNVNPQQNELKINIKLDDLKKILESDVEAVDLANAQNENKLAYAVLSKKFSLPDYDQMEDDFEISLLDINGYFIRNIRRRLVEKADFFLKNLENYFSGEPLIAAAREMEHIGEIKVRKLEVIFTRLMYYERWSTQIGVHSSEEREVEFINAFFNEWQKLKVELQSLLSDIKDTWSAGKGIEGKVKYFN